MNASLTFTPDGLGHGPYTEAIDLGLIGTLSVARATTIEFDNQAQYWRVRDPDGSALFNSPSRQECLAKVRALLWARYGLEPGDVDAKLLHGAWQQGESVDQFVAWIADKYDLVEITGAHEESVSPYHQAGTGFVLADQVMRWILTAAPSVPVLCGRRRGAADYQACSGGVRGLTLPLEGGYALPAVAGNRRATSHCAPTSITRRPKNSERGSRWVTGQRQQCGSR